MEGGKNAGVYKQISTSHHDEPQQLFPAGGGLALLITAW